MAQFTTTYATLISQIELFVEDDSTEFESSIQGCVNRAEERILNDLDLALFNTTQTTATAQAIPYTTRSITTSPIHSIYLTSAGRHIERRSLDYIQSYGGSGAPLYFYESETRIWWAPVPDAVYSVSITHPVNPTPLSGSNDTNWITQNTADLLLWASLVEAERFLIAPERVTEFEASYAARLGPIRAYWRADMQTGYEPINPTPTPTQTR